ncbi:hypothetical protein FKM82_008231 [Ascaphus truei]
MSVLDCVLMFLQIYNSVQFSAAKTDICHLVCIKFPMAHCPLIHAGKKSTDKSMGLTLSHFDPAKVVPNIITIIYKDHPKLSGISTHQFDRTRVFK